jgi:hypothetical protein
VRAIRTALVIGLTPCRAAGPRPSSRGRDDDLSGRFPRHPRPRRLALGLLKQNPAKQSIARKRKEAALDCRYLEEILTGATKVEKV